MRFPTLSALACLAGALASTAAHGDVASLCDRADTLSLPGAWTRIAGDAESYRSNTSAEVVTTAVYGYTRPLGADAMHELVTRAAAIGRAGERALARGAVTLSPVETRRIGRTLRLCYAGHEVRADRRFFSMTTASPQQLQHVYYEALGTGAAAFDHRASVIFGAGGSAISRALTGGPPAALPPLTGGVITLPAPLPRLGR